MSCLDTRLDIHTIHPFLNSDEYESSLARPPNIEGVSFGLSLFGRYERRPTTKDPTARSTPNEHIASLGPPWPSLSAHFGSYTFKLGHGPKVIMMDPSRNLVASRSLVAIYRILSRGTQDSATLQASSHVRPTRDKSKIHMIGHCFHTKCGYAKACMLSEIGEFDTYPFPLPVEDVDDPALSRRAPRFSHPRPSCYSSQHASRHQLRHTSLARDVQPAVNITPEQRTQSFLNSLPVLQYVSHAATPPVADTTFTALQYVSHTTTHVADTTLDIKPSVSLSAILPVVDTIYDFLGFSFLFSKTYSFSIAYVETSVLHRAANILAVAGTSPRNTRNAADTHGHHVAGYCLADAFVSGANLITIALMWFCFTRCSTSFVLCALCTINPLAKLLAPPPARPDTQHYPTGSYQTGFPRTGRSPPPARPDTQPYPTGADQTSFAGEHFPPPPTRPPTQPYPAGLSKHSVCLC
jgi:hypothetical protein